MLLELAGYQSEILPGGFPAPSGPLLAYYLDTIWEPLGAFPAY
jgi:hypothetical protein